MRNCWTLRVDLAQRLVSVNGQEVKLTPTEYDLLKIFIKHRGKIMTQQMLLTQMWELGMVKILTTCTSSLGSYGGRLDLIL